MQNKKSVIIQISLLFLIQWLSISVVVLNALALNASKDSDQGLIMATDTDVQDFILLIMAAASLFAVSLLLCIYLQIFFGISTGLSIQMSINILVVEIVFAVLIIALWTSATAIVLSSFSGKICTYFQVIQPTNFYMYVELSACRHISKLSTRTSFDNSNVLSSRACNLVDTMIVVGKW